MDSNTHSSPQLGRRPGGLATLAAAINELATQDLDGLNDVALAERVLTLRRLVDRLEGHWLKELAAVDAAAPPGPTRTNRPGRPPPGFGTGSAWAPAPPRARSGPPGPCSAAH